MPWRKKPEVPMASKLTLEVLWALTPMHEGAEVKAGVTEEVNPCVNHGVTDSVTRAARSLLFDAVKTQPHVQRAFYPEDSPPAGMKQVDFGKFPVSSLATSLFAQSIARHKDLYGFHDIIDRSAVEDKLRDIYSSLQWKKLGFQLYTLLYPDVVRDHETNIRLRDFMGDDAHVWAEQLVARLSETSWTRATQQRLFRGELSDADYNQEMNGLFLKLHLLDPQSVIPAYQTLLNQRALPSVNLELATRNYLGGPIDPDLLTSAVIMAVDRETTPMHQVRKSMNADTLVDVTYGEEVEEFVMTHCRNDDLWTGSRPDNCRTVKAKDKCVVM